MNAVQTKPKRTGPWHVAILVGILSVTWGDVGRIQADDESTATVKMIVDYGDGVQKHFVSIACKKKMVVLDALQIAASHPRGIEFKYRGKGATGFLTEIDGLKNEGRKRNWIYKVNGELGDRSFAVFPLDKGDVVLWRFGKYE